MRVYAVLACALAWLLRPGQAADHSFTVAEGLPTGTPVGSINTRRGLSYAFSSPPKEFHLNPITGEITTAMVIDREILANDFLDLFIQSNPSGQHLVEIRITVLDVNDNSPIFPRAEITVSFSESDKAGTQVILDTATDKDIGINDVTNDYQFVSGNKLRRFRLVLLKLTATPLLYLENTVVLDREEISHYKLNISIHDGANPSRYGFLIVNIEVRDVNDNPPLFDQSDYSVSINETIPLFSSIMQVHATDTDSGSNADITYSVVNDDFSQFTIAPKSGIVSTLKRLQCHRPCDIRSKTCHPNSCVVTLEARDHGHPFPLSGRAYLTVNLVDENDHAPVISFQYYPTGSPYAMVDEGAQVDTIVAVVSIADADTGINGDTSTRILSGNEAGHFVLSLSQGFNTIRVAGRLDREYLATYNLTVEARDHGRPSRSSIAVLHITVNDINDHQPEFVTSSHHVTLNELVRKGSFVTIMRAEDGDSGDNARLTYSVVSGDELNWFHIDPSSGLVTTQKPLDYETRKSLQLKVQVKDGATQPLHAFANLSITIVDENDEDPQFSSAVYNVTIVEDDVNLPKRVITVTATDRDSGTNGTVRYSLDSQVERIYRGMFRIDRSTGEITALRAVDREMYPCFKLVVWAEDMAVVAKSSSIVVNIHVADVNDNSPIFYPVRYYASVHEDDKNRARLLCVSASDLDAVENGTVQYALADSISQQTASMFTIDSIGCLWTRGHAFRQAIQSLYVIHVTASDMSGRHAPLPAVIEVTVQADSSSSPVFIRPESYHFVINEDVIDTDVGLFVGLVTARGGNDGRLTYTIVSGDPKSVFRIHSPTGRIITAKSVDREIQASYSIRVVASDGLSFGETIVNITVLDANDNAPVFETNNLYMTISETAPIGDTLLHLDARDADEGDNAVVTYSFPVTSNIFGIDRNSGVITLTKNLRATEERQFQMIVVATDSGKQSMSANVRITISVTDENMHSPRFQQDYHIVLINESIAVGERFHQMNAVDKDFDSNGYMSYSLVDGNEALKFGIFPDGHIYIAHSLDREKTNLYALRVNVKDGGYPSRSSITDVIIHIMDINDNSPRFTNDTYKFVLQENQPALTIVGCVRAHDVDAGANADVLYTIQTTSKHFQIDPISGVITSLHPFDREALGNKRDYFNLVVSATDSGQPRRRGSCLVIISVADLNDNSPVFLHSPYRQSVTEAAAVGTAVLIVSATDADLNAATIYSILHGNAEEKFSMDNKTGHVRIASELDREHTSAYTLTILGVDAEKPDFNTTTHVYITVLDDNDNAPTFEEYTMTIDVKEDMEVGELVVKMSAADLDLGDNSTISFQLEHNKFDIDKTTGDISMSEGLDYEQKTYYVLHVIATDAGKPPLSATCTININIIDVNDNDPQFQSGPIIKQITEGAAVGTSVAVVSAMDADSGDNGRLQYSIVKHQPESEMFTINSTSGLITTSAELDRELVNQYRLMVQVSDQSRQSPRRSAQKLVTVAIGDRNDNSPVFVSASSIAIDSDVRVGNRIAAVHATDADIGDNAAVLYSIVAGESDIFHVNETTGSLYLQKQMSERMHEITVSARDGGQMGRSTGSHVDDVRTAFHRISIFPIMLNSDGLRFARTRYHSTVKENELTATSVLAVGVTDADERHVTYHVTEVTSGGVRQPRYFQVHSTSGLISTTQPLDYERGYVVFLLRVFAVEISSHHLYTHSTLVEIELTDTNDNPPLFIPPSYDLQVSADKRPGDVLTVVIATDLDADSTLHYGMKQGGDGIFGIDPIKGELSLLSALPDDRTQYNLIISASDGLHETSADVLIHIKSSTATTSSLRFTRPVYWFEVCEEAQRGSRVGRVSVDRSSGVGVVVYRWRTQWAREVFRVHPQTGVVSLNAETLDYEQISLYVLMAEVQDSNAHVANVSVYINVCDSNDNAPMFDITSYSQQLYENVTAGTTVLTVTATDMDSGMNGVIHYYVTEGNEDGRFMVDEKNGTIIVVKSVDRERQPFYMLTITAVDQPTDIRKQLSTITTVTVTVKDVNDNAPEFHLSTPVTISEHSPIGSSVFTVSASDRDEANNALLSYTLTHDTFRVHPSTGVVYTTRLLDRERVPSYQIRVVAMDSGHPALSSAAEIQIAISDENDHSPVISKEYSIVLAEDVKVGSHVLTVDATDADVGVNGALRYVIISGDPMLDFHLNFHSGRLSVQSSLDYERVRGYRLQVKVHDVGEPQRSSTTDVVVEITDINDCTPTFLDVPYVGYVLENGPVHVIILRLNAVDCDSGGNSAVTYAIQQGEMSTFRVNETTGELSILQVLDREQRSRYELVVIATDSGTPALSSTTKVTILVTDANDHCPVFTRHVYVASVQENLTTTPQPVVRVMASDDDIGDNARIRYSLDYDHDATFHINHDTGDITCVRPLDRERVSAYTLVVTATDAGVVPCDAQATVLVNVADVNDNRPEFSQKAYSAALRDPTQKGWFVLGVRADDMDTSHNAHLTYTLNSSSHNDGDPFTVDSQTGVITTRSHLVARPGGYQLHVTVSDQGNPALNSVVPVTISFLPSETRGFPEFRTPQHSVRLTEGATSHLVGTYTAIESAATIRYRIAGGDVDGVFTVAPSSGELHGRVDYEQRTHHSLVIEATDVTTTLTGHMWLHVDVVDTNDNRPAFSRPYYNVSISERVIAPHSLITLAASDEDSLQNGRFTYKLVNAYNGLFDIDSQQGALSLLGRLDREDVESYTLKVLAVDQGSPQLTGSATVLVHVLDENDNPPVFTEYFTASVHEGASNGTRVIHVTSTDADIGINARHTYALSDNSVFCIDSNSGVVTVCGLVARQTYVIGVSTRDGVYRQETSLTIHVIDVNNHRPKFTAESYEFYMTDASIGVVHATDADLGPNADVYYKLAHPSGLIDIDPETGALSGVPPYGSTVLTVLAVDRGLSPLTGRCTVTVLRGHLPWLAFDRDEYSVPIETLASIGHELITLQASVEAKSLSEHLVYSIAGGNASRLFMLDAASGKLTVSQPLSSYLHQRFIIHISATSHNTSAKCSVNVQVVSPNLHAPRFHGDKFSVTIAENTQVDTQIAVLFASDDDVNDKVTYSLVASANGLFRVDGGRLIVDGQLDYESERTPQLVVMATDNAPMRRNTTVVFTVYLMDFNDNPPMFNTKIIDADISENSPVGTSIVQLTATDADSMPNNVIHYDIVDSAMPFTVDKMSGRLYSSEVFDYESRREYTIQVTASNPNTELSNEVTVHVRVTGVNEFRPKFVRGRYEFTVSEASPPGVTIGSVSATDRDDNDMVVYHLVGDSNMYAFTVDKNGNVVVTRPIDRESTNQIALSVLATNADTVTGVDDYDTCIVTVIISDANDSPRFAQATYTRRIREDATIGSEVVHVAAIDRDLKADDSRFTYHIHSGGGGGQFRIDSHSGLVTVNGWLDRETVAMYNVTVMAVDTGIPPQTGTAQLLVHITDVNDNAPYFKPHVPRGSILENQPPMTAIAIDLKPVTYDSDRPPNRGPYRYQLVNASDTFQLGELSGLVQARRRLDREEGREYVLSVQVTDSGGLTSQGLVVIEVTDQNDNAPIPRPMNIDVYAIQGGSLTGVIADVRPLDRDSMGQYTCRITSRNRDVYDVRNGCELAMETTPVESEYRLYITANDGFHTDVTYPVRVHVHWFPRAATDASVSLKLSVEPSNFLEDSYESFLESIESGLDQDVQVLSMSTADGVVGMLLAAHNSSGRYMDRQQLTDWLLSSRVMLANENPGIDEIRIDGCTQTYCSNGGVCKLDIQLNDDLFTSVTSDTRIVTSHAVSTALTCHCGNDFTGDRCQTPQVRCGVCARNAICCPLVGCVCTSGWRGPSCAVDVNECDASPCQHNGRCVNTQGSYRCICHDNADCDETTVDDMPTCPQPAQSYLPLSYSLYNISVHRLETHISLHFKTLQSNSLLLYSDGIDRFVAMEIVNGNVRYSLSPTVGDVTRVDFDKRVDDGYWHQVDIVRMASRVVLKLTDCPADGVTCPTCRNGDVTCEKVVEGKRFEDHTIGGELLSVGGMKSIGALLSHPTRVSTHDFVGCMRQFQIDGRSVHDVLLASRGVSDTCNAFSNLVSCSEVRNCDNGGTCVSDFVTASCQCVNGFSGAQCEHKVKGGFSFAAGAYVSYTLKETYRRDVLLTDAARGRQRRATTTETNTISMNIRSAQSDGLLFYGGDSAAYTALYIYANQLHYISVVGGRRNSLVSSLVNVSDSEWHHVTLTITGTSSVILSVDSAMTERLFDKLHMPLSLNAMSFTIGGSRRPLLHQHRKIDYFSGCLRTLEVNGMDMPLGGSTEAYSIEVVGTLSSECHLAVIGEPRTGSSSTVAVIVIVTFFCLALILLLVVFIVVRRRRKLAEKQQHGGSVLVNSADKVSANSQHDSGITDDVSDETIIRQHVSSQLAARLYPTDHMGSRPDVIRPETHDNSCFVTDTPPELYDIDNASSIAPSELADVVAHYRMYREGGGVAPTPRKHPHRRNYTPDVQPRRTSPLAPQGESVRSTPLSGIVGLFPSNASSSSSPAPSFSEVAGPTRGRSRGGHAHSKGRGHGGPVVNGLSIDEVDRLNRRTRCTGSPPGVLTEEDGESTDSDTHINRVDFTHADLIHQAPSDSDSESAASFTCSESATAVNMPVSTAARVNTDDSSVTTLFASSDDDQHNWQQLLDWRPDFGRFVGVFNDIAQLPDDARTRQQSSVSPRPMSVSPRQVNMSVPSPRTVNMSSRPSSVSPMNNVPAKPVVSPKPANVTPRPTSVSPRAINNVSPVVSVPSPVIFNDSLNSPRYANIAERVEAQEEYV